MIYKVFRRKHNKYLVSAQFCFFKLTVPSQLQPSIMTVMNKAHIQLLSREEDLRPEMSSDLVSDAF